MQTLRGRPYPDPGVDVMNTDSRDFWRGEAVWTIVSCRSFRRCCQRTTGGQVVNTHESLASFRNDDEATASPWMFQRSWQQASLQLFVSPSIFCLTIFLTNERSWDGLSMT